MRWPWHERGGRLGLAVLGALAGVALLADVLASDLPLAVRVDGTTWVLPCLTRPAALRGETARTLEARAEWLWRTPIGYGPLQTVASTGEARAEPLPWGPGGGHVLGTDELGRDVAARLVHGARVSLLVGLVSVLVSVLIGLLVGGVAGYWGGLVDAVLSRAVEVAQTFPLVFFLMALLSVLRAQGAWPLVIALGVTRWADVARLVRAEVLSLKTREYVLAARALGASHARIVFRHLLPNAMGPVVVTATLGVGSTILLESALSFLGLGVAPPTPSWGELLTQAHRTLVHPGTWWPAIFPGAAIAITVLSVNAVGEAMRRTVDGRP